MNTNTNHEQGAPERPQAILCRPAVVTFTISSTTWRGWVVGKRFISEHRMETAPDIFHLSEGCEVKYLDDEPEPESKARTWEELVTEGVAIMQRRDSDTPQGAALIARCLLRAENLGHCTELQKRLSGSILESLTH